MNQNLHAVKTRAGESFLVANDGQYLGKISLNQYDPESISNSFGSYGNQYSSTSIYNQYGNYGSPYSSLSPFNQYTSTPPSIYLHGQFFGYLSKNPYLGTNVVDPQNLLFWMKEKNLNY